MLKGFMSYLEDYLDKAGSIGLVKAALGILAFASVLSALFGSTAVKAGALVLCSLCTLGLLVVLTKANTQLRHELDEYRDDVTEYCDAYYRQFAHTWRIDSWEEKVTILPNGDASGSIVVRALIEAEDLPFFRLRIGPNWKQPDKYRRRVHVTTWETETDGEDTQWRRTQNWLKDGRLEVLAHFGSASPRKGAELALRFDYEWPGKAIPLMRRRVTDEFTMLMGRPLAHFSYRIILPSGMQARSAPIGLHKGIHDFEHTPTTDRLSEVHLVANDIDADHRIGLRLHLA